MTAQQIAVVSIILAAPVAHVIADVLAVRWLERWERRFTEVTDTREATDA
ncbi:hypothetical protein [Nocardioides panaciterrulae]|uniref:Uncharacterized protein n=1 Tax=Nocardioides panaciterrulae TaxID=661492 RepID=A0A7Y9EAM1_9ACTN|nr:hypothetical protein [Nocardioides panaciterrulae]NYD39934.1 hypothetical protein [Nocardioides panaciterrulae]NYD43966.1 hypothetical protein [Nocardioides panaciterrulae]